MRFAYAISLIAMSAVIGTTVASFAEVTTNTGITTFHQDFSARRKVRRIGACDGFQRCRCGVTAARKAGLPLNYNGFNLKRAVEWTRAFPRSSIHAGAVGYVRKGGPSGHVFTVVNYNGGSTATVYDDRGTYERNISNAIFVSVHGGIRYSEMTYKEPDRFGIN